jgi:hypothetical protein
MIAKRGNINYDIDFIHNNIEDIDYMETHKNMRELTR